MTATRTRANCGKKSEKLVAEKRVSSIEDQESKKAILTIDFILDELKFGFFKNTKSFQDLNFASFDA